MKTRLSFLWKAALGLGLILVVGLGLFSGELRRLSAPRMDVRKSDDVRYQLAEIGKPFDPKTLGIHLAVSPGAGGGRGPGAYVTVVITNLTQEPRTVFLMNKLAKELELAPPGTLRLVNTTTGRPHRLKSGSMFAKRQPSETTLCLGLMRYRFNDPPAGFALPPNRAVGIYQFKIEDEFEMEEADEYELTLIPKLYYIAAVKGDEGVFKRQEFPPVTARMIVPVRK